MDASTLVLPTTLFLTALSFVMSGLAIVFQIWKERLPAATRFENLRESSKPRCGSAQTPKSCPASFCVRAVRTSSRRHNRRRSFSCRPLEPTALRFGRGLKP